VLPGLKVVFLGTPAATTPSPTEEMGGWCAQQQLSRTQRGVDIRRFPVAHTSLRTRAPRVV